MIPSQLRRMYRRQSRRAFFLPRVKGFLGGFFKDAFYPQLVFLAKRCPDPAVIFAFTQSSHQVLVQMEEIQDKYAPRENLHPFSDPPVTVAANKDDLYTFVVGIEIIEDRGPEFFNVLVDSGKVTGVF